MCERCCDGPLKPKEPASKLKLHHLEEIQELGDIELRIGLARNMCSFYIELHIGLANS